MVPGAGGGQGGGGKVVLAPSAQAWGGGKNVGEPLLSPVRLGWRIQSEIN